MKKSNMTCRIPGSFSVSVCFLLIACCPILLKSQDNFPWPEGKKFAISISFDDSRQSNIDHGIPLLDKYGVRATFYVHPNVVKESLPAWKQVVANGHEIGNHTLVHPCSENFAWARKNPLEAYTLASMKEELLECGHQTKELLGVMPTSFAYPCGQTFVGRGEGKKSYVPVVAELFTSGRGWLDEAPADPLFCDLAEVSGMKMDDMDFGELMPLIEHARANNLWLVLVGHDTKAERSAQNTRLTFLAEFCKYVRAHDDIWSATVGNVAAYIETTRTNGRLLKSEPLSVQENGAGDLNLKASLGKGLGPKIEYMPDWKAYGWWTAEDSAVWNVDVSNPGTFRVVLEWSISDEEAGKDVEFHLGEKKIVTKIPSSGSWETFKKMEIGQVELPAGRHKVIVKPANRDEKGYFMDVRSIQLIRK